MSQPTTVKALTASHVFPNFYACYLLRSLRKRYEKRTYVGSTPNPARRIRQHNGELTAGARTTSKYRPWEMVCIVYGFPSHLAALQFEWAWQNPHRSRQMPAATKQALLTQKNGEPRVGRRTRGGKSRAKRFRPSLTLAGKLANMHSMLTVDAWRRWPLHVKVFSEDVWETWNKHCSRKDVPALPPWTTAELDLERKALQVDSLPDAAQEDEISSTILQELEKTTKKTTKKELAAADAKAKAERMKAAETQGGMMNLDVVDKPLREEQAAKLSYIDSLSPADLTCHICKDHLDGKAHLSFIICPETRCNHLSHTTCLGQEFMKDEPDALLPTHGACPACHVDHAWGRLLKGSHFRHLLQTKGAVDVDEDEFADLENDGQSESDMSSMTSSSVMSVSSAEEPLISRSSQKRGPGRPRKTSRSKSPRRTSRLSPVISRARSSPDLLVID